MLDTKIPGDSGRSFDGFGDARAMVKMWYFWYLWHPAYQNDPYWESMFEMTSGLTLLSPKWESLSIVHPYGFRTRANHAILKPRLRLSFSHPSSTIALVQKKCGLRMAQRRGRKTGFLHCHVLLLENLTTNFNGLQQPQRYRNVICLYVSAIVDLSFRCLLYMKKCITFDLSLVTPKSFGRRHLQYALPNTWKRMEPEKINSKL